MKRLFACLLAFMLLLSLAGCADSRRGQNRAAALEAAKNFYDYFGVEERGFFRYTQGVPEEIRGYYIDAGSDETLTFRTMGEPSDELKALLYEACGTGQIAFDWPEFTQEELEAASDAVLEYNETMPRPLCGSWGANKVANCVRFLVSKNMIDTVEALREEHPCIVYQLIESELTPAAFEGMKTDPAVTLTTDRTVYSAEDKYAICTLQNGSDQDQPFSHQLYLEVLLDGAWQEIPYRPDVSFTADLHVVGKGKSANPAVNFGSFDYDFPPGRYRVLVQYALEFAPVRGRGWDHVAYAEFEIK